MLLRYRLNCICNIEFNLFFKMQFIISFKIAIPMPCIYLGLRIDTAENFLQVVGCSSSWNLSLCSEVSGHFAHLNLQLTNPQYYSVFDCCSYEWESASCKGYSFPIVLYSTVGFDYQLVSYHSYRLILLNIWSIHDVFHEQMFQNLCLLRPDFRSQASLC